MVVSTSSSRICIQMISSGRCVKKQLDSKSWYYSRGCLKSGILENFVMLTPKLRGKHLILNYLDSSLSLRMTRNYAFETAS